VNWHDVYVRPFPGPGGKVRVSTAGGVFPHWSAAGHELLFAAAGGKVMVVPYTIVGDAFRADKATAWSPTNVGTRLGSRSTGFANGIYDLHPDGKRIALDATQAHDAGIQNKVVFISNFFDYVDKIAPGQR
jgi:serine/threonine-protein kinase